MQLEAKVDTGALRVLAQSEDAWRDAADQAVVRQTRDTVDAMRDHIAVRLSQRAAGTVTSELVIHQRTGAVRGLIFSRWWRRAKTGVGDRDGAWDMLAAFERGAVIRPVGAQRLALPLPAAYNVVGLSATSRRGRRGGLKAPTVEAVETALNQDLFPLYRRGRNVVLCAREVAISSSRRGTIRPATYRSKAGRLVTRGGVRRLVPMFVLLKNSRLPKRLDFGPITAQGEQRLGEKLIVELAARDLL